MLAGGEEAAVDRQLEVGVVVSRCRRRRRTRPPSAAHAFHRDGREMHLHREEIFGRYGARERSGRTAFKTVYPLA